MIDGLTFADYSMILAAATLGAFVQGSIGFGAAMFLVPAVALVAPEALPVAVIVWAIPLAVAMVIREHRDIDWSGVRWIVVGRLPGTAMGAWVVTAVTAKTLSAIAGGAVLLAVATSLLTISIPLTWRTKTTAGFASGLIGTSTSIGGPPLALLYQHKEGVVVRSTLAVCFVFSTLTSLAVLTAVGVTEGQHVLLGLALQPAALLGLALSQPMTRYLDGRRLRPALLTVAAIAATAAILRSL